MPDPNFRPSHRQLISAVIALLEAPDSPTYQPVLRQLGYELHSVDHPMVDQGGQRYELDLLVTNIALDNVLLVDCKTWSDKIEDDNQVRKYLRTASRDVVALAGLTVPTPSRLESDAVFVIMPDVETRLREVLSTIGRKVVAGMGIIAVEPSRFFCIHDELSNSKLSESLDGGWEIELELLPLERLPYEHSSPRYDLADAMFQALLELFITGASSFTVDDVCELSNPCWKYLQARHETIRNRVGRELRRMRETALKDWIDPVRGQHGMITGWNFTRKTSNRQRQRTVAGFHRRHMKYIGILKTEGREPDEADFIGIDADQLVLTTIDGDPVEFDDAEGSLTDDE